MGSLIMSDTIHQEISIDATAQQIYDALTIAAKFSKLSEAPTEIDPTPGGQFSCFGGMISGQTIEAISGKMLVQAWRVGFWEPGFL